MVDLLAFWSDPLILPIYFWLWLKLQEWTLSLLSLVPRAPWPDHPCHCPSGEHLAIYNWSHLEFLEFSIIFHPYHTPLFLFSFFSLFLSHWDSFLKEPIKSQIWPPGRLSARYPSPETSPTLYKIYCSPCSSTRPLPCILAEVLLFELLKFKLISPGPLCWFCPIVFLKPCFCFYCF